MADSLFSVSLIYALLCFFGTRDWRYRLLLIPQFTVGWLVIELAWFHAIIQAALIALVIFDLGDFSFFTLLGLVIGGYNIYRFLQLHKQGQATHSLLQGNLSQTLGSNFLKYIPDFRQGPLQLKADKFKKPFSFSSPDVDVVHGIRYGDDARNTLDIHLKSLL